MTRSGWALSKHEAELAFDRTFLVDFAALGSPMRKIGSDRYALELAEGLAGVVTVQIDYSGGRVWEVILWAGIRHDATDRALRALRKWGPNRHAACTHRESFGNLLPEEASIGGRWYLKDEAMREADEATRLQLEKWGVTNEVFGKNDLWISGPESLLMAAARIGALVKEHMIPWFNSLSNVEALIGYLIKNDKWNDPFTPPILLHFTGRCADAKSFVNSWLDRYRQGSSEGLVREDQYLEFADRFRIFCDSGSVPP